jgi:hypothetical protein
MKFKLRFDNQKRQNIKKEPLGLNFYALRNYFFEK